MAEVSGLDMVREIIGQINNLRRLVTINGKKFKWDGKKYVRAVDGKTFTKKELVSYVKDQKFEAPKTPKARKGELKVDGKTVYKKTDKLGDLKSKAQGLKSQALKIKNKGNQALQNAKLRIMQPEGAGVIDRRQRSINKRIGKGGAVLPIIDAVIDKTRLPDRASNFLSNMMFGQNMNLAQRDALNAKRMAAWNNRNNKKPNPEDVREDQLVNFLKVQKTSPIENSINERDIREDQLVNLLKTQKTNPVKETYVPEKVITPPNQGTDSTKKETVDQNKVKVVKAPKEQLKAKTVEKKDKKKESLKVNKQLERRKKAIKRAYGNISEKRLKQLLSRAVTQRELEES